MLRSSWPAELFRGFWNSAAPLAPLRLITSGGRLSQNAAGTGSAAWLWSSLILLSLLPHVTAETAPFSEVVQPRLPGGLVRGGLFYEAVPGQSCFARFGESVLVVEPAAIRLAVGGGSVGVASVSLAGASPEASVQLEQPEGASGSRRVRVSGVYPGVDLVVHSRQGSPEYEFELMPGADPSQIRLEVTGSRGAKATLNPDGSLSTRTSAGDVRQAPPVAYQPLGGGRVRSIESSFVVLDGGDIGFKLSSYDPARRLVIDPLFLFSTYIPGVEESPDMTVDAQGNLYLSGSTHSTELLVRSAIQGERAGIGLTTDLFVMKFSKFGDILYSTYIGGSSFESLAAAMMESDGSLTLVANSASTDFPLTDPSGNIVEGKQSPVLVRINPEGSAITLARVLPLPSAITAVRLSSGDIAVGGVVADDTFAALAVGGFQSSRSAFNDGFVASISPNGEDVLGFSYWGGTSYDHVQMLAPAADGSFYALLNSQGTDVPGIASLWPPNESLSQHAVVSRIAADCSQQKFATYLDRRLSRVDDLSAGRLGRIAMIGHSLDRIGDPREQVMLEMAPDGRKVTYEKSWRLDRGFVPWRCRLQGQDSLWVLASSAPPNQLLDAGYWRRRSSNGAVLYELGKDDLEMRRLAEFPHEALGFVTSSADSVYLLAAAWNYAGGEHPPGFLFQPVSSEPTWLGVSHMELTGRSGSGRLAVSRSRVYFGHLGSTPADGDQFAGRRRTVSIRNRGAGRLEGWISPTAAQRGRFFTVSGDGFYSLEEGESRSVVIEWQPEALGNKPDHASFTITSTDPRRPGMRIPLLGLPWVPN